MLSKGGKKSHVCPNCESPNIRHTGEGFTLSSLCDVIRRWIYIPANCWICGDCGHFNRWSTRRSVASIDDDIGFSRVDVEFHSGLVENIERVEQHDFSFVPESKRIVIPNYVIPVLPPKGRVQTYREREGFTEVGVPWAPDGKEDRSHWTHRPDDFGIWVGYNSWRFKDIYNVMLKDGRIVKGCYPNASSFTPMLGIDDYRGSISEFDIIAVQLATWDDVKDSFWRGGDTEEESNLYRANNNARVFGNDTPEDWRHIKPLLFDTELKETITVKVKAVCTL